MYVHLGQPVGSNLNLHGNWALGEPSAPATDSPAANRFVIAHRSRWCSPGQEGKTCKNLVAPRQIRRVVIHNTASAPENNCIRYATINEVVQGWQNSGREASAHYLVDRDGTITQMVQEGNVAFHVIGHNRDTIGIEHADVCSRPDAYTTQLYERSAELVRDIAARNGFAVRVFGIDTNNANDATVIGHQFIGHHGDPGVYWDWEYYAKLLHWDGRTPSTRPLRLIAVTSQGIAAPIGWQVQRRAQVLGETRPCIPNTHCADQRHSFGDTYLRAEANTKGQDVLFGFQLQTQGLYKVSLWWPNVRGANPSTSVTVDAQKAGGPAMANANFDQRSNNGRWNDIGQPFTFTVPYTGAKVIIRIARASQHAGLVLADAARILKVG